MRYPINCDTLYLGGILTSIWMWSGHASASIISTPLYSHNFLIILPISDFICPYITCLRYFGANTIWYLQFHLVCAKLSVSSFFFNTGIPPLILCDVVGKPSLLYLRRFIFSTHRRSLFRATGIARGCLLQNKVPVFVWNTGTFSMGTLIVYGKRLGDPLRLQMLTERIYLQHDPVLTGGKLAVPIFEVEHDRHIPSVLQIALER